MKNVTYDLIHEIKMDLQFKYSCYCFTLLLNSTHLKLSSEYFRLICIVFLSEFNTPMVEEAKEKIKIALSNRPEELKQLDKIIQNSLNRPSSNDIENDSSKDENVMKTNKCHIHFSFPFQCEEQA